MSNKKYKVTQQFKEQITEILQTKKFGAVYPYMNLINREGFDYEENELNSIVALLAEFPYGEVAEFFTNIKTNVIEIPQEQEKDETVSAKD
jgi:hypothetical protein